MSDRKREIRGSAMGAVVTGTDPLNKLTGAPQSNIATNRGDQVKRDDTVKNYYLGLYDIDECIQYYFDNIIQPTVDDGDEYVKVPMIYGSPERWVSVQENGYLRDQQGKLQIPAIVYRRTSVAKNRNLSNKLDANNPHFHYTFQKQYNNRNRYDNFAVLNDIKPSTENYNVVIPDFVTLTYECIIWTEYVEQMNKIVESINYAEDSYWGDPEKFKFRALVEDFSSETELAADVDRTVRTAFTISMEGYIIPDSMNKALADQEVKTFGPVQTVFNTRAVVEQGGQLIEIEESPPTTIPEEVVFENNYAVEFDGVDDCINLGNNALIKPTDNLTYSIWAKLADWSGLGQHQIVVPIGCVSTGGWKIELRGSWALGDAIKVSSDIRVTDTGAGSGGYLHTIGTLALDSQFDVNGYSTALADSNGWHHFAMSYQKATGVHALYMNGVLIGQGQAAAGADISYLNASAQVMLGGDWASSTSVESPFAGQLDEVAIWNDVLSADEIEAIYNNKVPFDLTSNNGLYDSSASLRGYWRMGDPSGTWSFPTIKDVHTAHPSFTTYFDGTMINMSADDIVAI